MGGWTLLTLQFPSLPLVCRSVLRRNVWCIRETPMRSTNAHGTTVHSATPCPSLSHLDWKRASAVEGAWVPLQPEGASESM